MKTGRSFVAALAFFGWCSLVNAVPILDQWHEGLGGLAYVEGDDYIDRAQTFTVGLDGNLTSVEIEIFRLSSTVGNLLWDIRTVASGVPTAPDIGPNILASGSLSPAEIGTTPSYLSLGPISFSVDIGDVLAVVFQNDAPDRLIGAHQLPSESYDDNYTRGVSFLRFESEPWFASENFIDLNFRTYVDNGCDSAQPNCNGTIPAPATIALFGLGLAGLGWSRRKIA